MAAPRYRSARVRADDAPSGSGRVPGAAVTLGPALAARADDYDAEISAIDNAFDAGIVRIQPGQSIEWSNDGNSPHTVTADDGSFDSGNLAPDATFTTAFDQPGVYAYFCTYHGAPGVGMAGIVVVGDAADPEPERW